jgi:hypothetical protein
MSKPLQMNSQRRALSRGERETRTLQGIKARGIPEFLDESSFLTSWLPEVLSGWPCALWYLSRLLLLYATLLLQ